MNSRTSNQRSEANDPQPGEIVLSAGRATDGIGRSLRRVFEVEGDHDERWTTLLRRLR